MIRSEDRPFLRYGQSFETLQEVAPGRFEATPKQLGFEGYPWPAAIFVRTLRIEFFMAEVLLEGDTTFLGYVYKSRTGETLRVETRWESTPIPDSDDSSLDDEECAGERAEAESSEEMESGCDFVESVREPNVCRFAACPHLIYSYEFGTFEEVSPGQFQATPQQLSLENKEWPAVIYSMKLELEFFMCEVLLEAESSLIGYVYKSRSGETLRVEKRRAPSPPDDVDSDIPF